MEHAYTRNTRTQKANLRRLKTPAVIEEQQTCVWHTHTHTHTYRYYRKDTCFRHRLYVFYYKHALQLQLLVDILRLCCNDDRHAQCTYTEYSKGSRQVSARRPPNVKMSKDWRRSDINIITIPNPYQTCALLPIPVQTTIGDNTKSESLFAPKYANGKRKRKKRNNNIIQSTLDTSFKWKKVYSPCRRDLFLLLFVFFVVFVFPSFV